MRCDSRWSCNHRWQLAWIPSHDDEPVITKTWLSLLNFVSYLNPGITLPNADRTAKCSMEAGYIASKVRSRATQAEAAVIVHRFSHARAGEFETSM